MATAAASFCRLPERLTGEVGAKLCQWPMGHVVTWTVVDSLPGWQIDELVSVYRQAWATWDTASGVKIEYVDSASRANILVGSRNIDGAFGVLAEAELPCGNITTASQLRVWFDNRDSWVAASNPPQGRVDLLRVAIHEFGHSLGIGHNQNLAVKAIMDPSVSSIRTLQPWDVDQIRLRYSVDVVPPVEPPGGGGTGTDIPSLLEDLAECIRQLTPARRAALERWLD